ncbi:MAG TPA: tripartite tricarboxylate transporter substrate-binding protein [Kiloniellaceae bacterium]|nr:tripartite tricarboxylate transporter substrate-binding protein [Kiloniellaceae bacterium]
MMRFSFSRTAAVLAVLVLGLFAAAPVAAETAADFYKGKVVKLVVGYGAGGGYDLYARMLAPHLEQRLGATVVVENRPGGGGMVAISQLAGAEPDGLTLVLANLEAAALGQILDSPGIRFDVRELPVVARVGSEPKVVLLGAGAPFRTIADLQAAERPVKWAAGGKTDGIGDSIAIFSQALELRSEIIIGYKGTKEAALAAGRGETDGLVASAGSARPLAAGTDLRAVAVLARQRSALVPEVPTIFEIVEFDSAQAWWIDYRAGLTDLGRTFIVSPGTPAERLAVLREAAAAVLNDPAVLAEAEATQRPIEHGAPEAVEALIAQSINALGAAEVERVRDVILNKYY